MEYYGQDISENETDSILRILGGCFKNSYHREWAGFCNQGYPASSHHRHMLWHSQFRQADRPHSNTWYKDTEENLMKEYISRRYHELILQVLEELRQNVIYSCSDPRLRIKEREPVNKLTQEAAKHHKEDFESKEETINNYIDHFGCIPYCVILQMLAIRYLGAGLLDSDYVDKDFPYRSSKSFSCMLWNLGNWQRSRFARNPLPERSEKYGPHINYDFDSEHKLIGNRPLYNNFVNVVKNPRAHLFMNCEAASIYEHGPESKKVATRYALMTTRIWW